MYEIDLGSGVDDLAEAATTTMSAVPAPAGPTRTRPSSPGRVLCRKVETHGEPQISIVRTSIPARPRCGAGLVMTERRGTRMSTTLCDPRVNSVVRTAWGPEMGPPVCSRGQLRENWALWT